MKIIKDEQPIQLGQDFNLTCKITLSLRQSECKRIIEKFEKITSLKAEYIKTV